MAPFPRRRMLSRAAELRLRNEASQAGEHGHVAHLVPPELQIPDAHKMQVEPVPKREVSPSPSSHRVHGQPKIFVAEEPVQLNDVEELDVAEELQIRRFLAGGGPFWPEAMPPDVIWPGEVIEAPEPVQFGIDDEREIARIRVVGEEDEML